MLRLNRLPRSRQATPPANGAAPHAGAPADGLTLAAAAAMDATSAMRALGSSTDGITDVVAARRLSSHGPNLVHVYRVRWPRVLLRQLNSPLLLLLAAASIGSYAVGERVNAGIIMSMIAISVVLGFTNEYRAERVAVDLHRSIRDSCTVVRSGQERRVPVSDLVPGDLVVLEMGCIVPADVRLTLATGLECNESILTGESTPGAKSAGPTAPPVSLSDYANCGFMGTVVMSGGGVGLVVATGPRAHFGAMALDLGLHQAPSAFEVGLRRFSRLLLFAAAGLSAFVFAANVLVQRPAVEALLFALAIAVGIAPEMLSAVVTISLSRGARLLARHKVVVKRLVSIEDLGNIDVLFTDKTGTLTEGRLVFESALDGAGAHSPRVLRLGLMATASAQSHTGLHPGHSALDQALWDQALAAGDGSGPHRYEARAPGGVCGLPADAHVVMALPFDHERTRSSVVIDVAGSQRLLVKGAPESVLACCDPRPSTLDPVLRSQFQRGARVIALAERPWQPGQPLDAAAESALTFVGLLVYRDLPKPGVADAVRRLHDLDIEVKVLTGDNPQVAARLCADIGITSPDDSTGVLTPVELDRMDDTQLAAALSTTRVFARISPEHKQRIVRVQRGTGADVACLGDGVNDALALHEADVGISVENATDIAKDAADVVLLEKDLHVLADGVVQGRRIFANTVKYVAMGSSSNFGNMVSAAAASAFLPFLPMLPAQILLNNLLYDLSQFPISTDRVDPEQLRRPAHWDISLIRRYMLFFGLVSSVFDITTFMVMLHGFDITVEQFRSAWFLESLATQTLVVLVIRTRRRPAWRSPPSPGLSFALVGAVAVGAVVLWSPLAKDLGLSSLPLPVTLTLTGLVVAYLAVVEAAKDLLNASVRGPVRRRTGPPPARRLDARPPHPQRRRLRAFTRRA